MPDTQEGMQTTALNQAPATTATVVPNVQPPPIQSSAGPSGDQPGNGKTLVLPQSAMKRIKDEAREKGKKEALLTYAKAQGFGSVEEFESALAQLKSGKSNGTGKPARQEAKAKPETRTEGERANGHARVDKRAMDRIERDRQTWQRERDQLQRRIRSEASNRRELQRQLDAREAEMALREKAVLSGVKDVNYAVSLLTRSLEGKSEEELRSFDEDKFYEGLRSTHPYLFSEVVRPATTGTGAGGAPAPKPGEAVRNQAQASQVDARKMKREEFQDYLRAKGLSIGP